MTKNIARQMWKKCFGDSNEFLDIFFNHVYKEENTLLHVENGVAVASLQMPVYQFTFCGEEVPVAYICGVCTLPEHRGKGYMAKLLTSALEVINQREIPLSVLIPAEKWLYDYYTKYGYAKVFEAGDEKIPLKKLLDNAAGNINEAYYAFDRLFRNKDFCIQKTKSDFQAIVKDLELDNYPPKTNLSGMARVISAEKLLSIFAKKHKEKIFTLEVIDKILPANSAIYSIKAGKCSKIISSQKADFSIDIKTTCHLLMGSNLDELPQELASNFENQKPILNLMLE